MNFRVLKQKSGIPLYGLGLIIAIGLMMSLRYCRPTWTGYDVGGSRGDTLDVLIEYTPMSFYTYDDTLGGFDYDLLRLLASRHGLALKFHPVVSLSRALTTLESGRCDLLIAEIPVTGGMKEHYLFLEPVRIDRQVLVQLRDSVTGDVRVKSQLDLAGDTLCIVAGSTVATRIANMSREIGDTIYVVSEPEYSSELLFVMTATGNVKMAVVGEQVARRMVKDYPNVDISTNISLSQFQSWIAGDRREWLADSLNRWIIEVKQTPEYSALHDRYIIKE